MLSEAAKANKIYLIGGMINRRGREAGEREEGEARKLIVFQDRYRRGKEIKYITRVKSLVQMASCLEGIARYATTLLYCFSSSLSYALSSFYPPLLLPPMTFVNKDTDSFV